MRWSNNLISCNFNWFMLQSYTESPSLKIRNKINIKQNCSDTSCLTILMVSAEVFVLNNVNNSITDISIVEPLFEKDQSCRLKKVPVWGGGAEEGTQYRERLVTFHYLLSNPKNGDSNTNSWISIPLFCPLI